MSPRPSDRLPEPDPPRPEVDHRAEDGALWAFVEYVAATPVPAWTHANRDEAERFLAWRERHKDRQKWYA